MKRLIFLLVLVFAELLTLPLIAAARDATEAPHVGAAADCQVERDGDE